MKMSKCVSMVKYLCRNVSHPSPSGSRMSDSSANRRPDRKCCWRNGTDSSNMLTTPWSWTWQENAELYERRHRTCLLQYRHSVAKCTLFPKGAPLSASSLILCVRQQHNIHHERIYSPQWETLYHTITNKSGNSTALTLHFWGLCECGQFIYRSVERESTLPNPSKGTWTPSSREWISF